MPRQKTDHWIYLNIAPAGAGDTDGDVDDNDDVVTGAAECARVLIEPDELGELSRASLKARSGRAAASRAVKARVEWLDEEDRRVEGFAEIAWHIENGTVSLRAIGPDRKLYSSDPLPRALLAAAAA